MIDRSVETKRQELMKVYPTPKWVDRVKKMADKQVIAVYFRLKEQGVIK